MEGHRFDSWTRDSLAFSMSRESQDAVWISSPALFLLKTCSAMIKSYIVIVSHTHFTALTRALMAVSFGHDTGVANRMCQRGYDVTGRRGRGRSFRETWSKSGRGHLPVSPGSSLLHGAICPVSGGLSFLLLVLFYARGP